MRIRILSFLLLLLATLSLPLRAQVYSVEQVPNVFVQDSLQLLSDPAGYIPSEEQAKINSALTRIRLERGVEFAVVLVPSIGDEGIEEFATQLFRSWGLGSKEKNEGLLLLIAIEQRRMRFETGYGLEGTLPDVLLSRIQRGKMRDQMREKDYGGAVLTAIGAVEQALVQDDFRGTRRSTGGLREFQIDWKIVGLFYLLIVLASGYSAWSSLADTERLGHRSPRWLRTQLPHLPQRTARSALLLGVLCLPVGILYYLYARRKQEELALLATRCPQCGSQLRFLDGAERLSYLSDQARLEERIGSRRYLVYRCGHCSFSESAPEDLGSHWQICERCGGRTSEVVSVRPVSIPGRGRYERTTLHCRYCGHDKHHDRRDTSAEDLAMSSILLTGLLSGGRHRGGGGGFGGGFSGGSFGGGSSGGGGSTGSW